MRQICHHMSLIMLCCEAASGSCVQVDKATLGARCYLAVGGGINTPKYLGSRATFPGGKLGGVQVPMQPSLLPPALQHSPDCTVLMSCISLHGHADASALQLLGTCLTACLPATIPVFFSFLLAELACLWLPRADLAEQHHLQDAQGEYCWLLERCFLLA